MGYFRLTVNPHLVHKISFHHSMRVVPLNRKHRSLFMWKQWVSKIKECKAYPLAKEQRATLTHHLFPLKTSKQAAELLQDKFHPEAWVLKQKEDTRGKTLNSCSETAVASDPTNHWGSEFLPKEKAWTLILFKRSCCSNKKQGGLWNYLLKANYIHRREWCY